MRERERGGSDQCGSHCTGAGSRAFLVQTLTY